jgi:deazaflavin-dependent oxidoreductase (nitroreductase family)
MTYEFDGRHATSAMAGAIQPACHQSDSATVGRLGADDGILEHVGRKSGTQFRTPLTVFTTDIDGQAGVAILLTYGPNRDWLKNITAASGGRIRRYGKTFSVQDPRVMPVEQAVLLTRAD